jgi:hypothetical protein
MAESFLHFFPNNSDAAFLPSLKPKPSELLLHYSYGAAAVKNWGRNHAILNNRPGLLRPKAPEPVPMGPRSVGDCTTTTAELVKRFNNNPLIMEAVWVQRQPDLEKPAWNEDDVMLFFWGNSKPSMERHAKKE